jgi:hypothetical protein
MERASFETDVRSYERADRTGDSEVSVPLKEAGLDEMGGGPGRRGRKR